MGAQPGDLGKHLPEFREHLRSGGPGELKPEQLARRREFNRSATKADVSALGGTYRSHPMMGPSTFMGKVHSGPEAAQFIRAPQRTAATIATFQRSGDPKLEERVRNFLVPPHPEDPSVNRAIAAHEGGEKALMVGAQKDMMKGAPTASHFGAMPVVAEQMAAWRDPEAQKVMSELRTRAPDDAFIAEKMKQFGATPNVPMPIGSKAHAKLEKALAERTPTHQMARQNRILGSLAGATHGMNIQSPTAKKVVEAIPKLQGPAQWLADKLQGTKLKIPGLAKVPQMVHSALAPHFTAPVHPANLAEILKVLPSLARKG